MPIRSPWVAAACASVVLGAAFVGVAVAGRFLLDQWMGNWSDLVEFEVHPVVSSAEAAAAVAALGKRTGDAEAG